MKITKCGRCNLWDGVENCISGFGNRKSKVVIIGESPGRLETHPGSENIPFIGEAGAILDWALHKAGVVKKGRRDEIYITNAVKCYPIVSINTEHKKRCKYWLKKELNILEPDLILVLGTNALQSVSGNYQASIEDMRGFWYHDDDLGFDYLPTIHPASILRGWHGTSSFYKDIRKFARAIKEGVPEQKIGSNYKIVKDLKGVKKVITLLHKKKRFTWDVESTSTRYWDPNEKTLGISFCWKTDYARYIPIHGEDCKEIWEKKEKKIILKLLKGLLETDHIKKDGQNIKFDINWVKAKHDITVAGTDWDTMQFHHLIDENTPANLTYLTTYYDLNFPKYDEAIKPYIKTVNDNKTFRFVPTKILGKYGCADVDATWRISKLQRGIDDDRQTKIYRELSVPISKFTRHMEYNGVLIDVDKISTMEVEYQKKIDSQNIVLSKKVGLDYFNVNSNPQMQEVLFGESKGSLTIDKKGIAKTKTGKPKTDKDTFEFVKRKYSKRKRVMTIIGLIEQVRSMRKMKSTYLTGFRKIVDAFNRVHTSYLSTGTVTGRTASTNPNLQNIPRDPIFRSLFISGPGRKFIAIDYVQIEARLIAWLALQLDMIRKFADRKFDIHIYNSAMVRRKKEKEVTKEERSIDKAVTFGINYGRSAKSISDTYNIPIEWVKKFIREYFEEFDSIYKWRKKQPKLAKKQGYLENKMGRHRHFAAYEWIYSEEMNDALLERERLGIDSFIVQALLANMDRQAINFPIQSYASDVLTQATDRVRKRIKEENIDAFLVLTVHDMIAVDCSNKDVDRMKVVLEEEMPITLTKTSKKTGKKIKMDFPIDIEVANCWVQ